MRPNPDTDYRALKETSPSVPETPSEGFLCSRRCSETEQETSSPSGPSQVGKQSTGEGPSILSPCAIVPAHTGLHVFAKTTSD